METRTRREALRRWLGTGEAFTAGEAADRFGASLRTIQRDVEALRGEGLPIDGSRGHGGGIRLARGARPTPVEFTSEEVLTLAISTRTAIAMGVAPDLRRAERALEKALASLPVARARQLKRLIDRIHVGERFPGAAPLNAPPASFFEAMERAFLEQRVLRFDYTDRKGDATHRRAEVHGLLVRPPVWYLIAWDVDKDAARLFRLDRVSRPRVLQRPALTRPLPAVTTGVCPDAVPVGAAPGAG